MLRDIQPSSPLPSPNALNASPTIELDKIFEFVDRHISSFSEYFSKNGDSDLENWISNLLVRHFQLCNQEEGGFLPCDFSKNPPQSQSGKETDIGVYVNTRSSKPIPIVEFEAKRFSKSSKYQEYVAGERGGIERFKRGEHSPHLKICGMFAYVQNRNSGEWITLVNRWITKLSSTNLDTTIDWTREEEKLVKHDSFLKVEKLFSSNYRTISKDSISLWHYFIDLT